MGIALDLRCQILDLLQMIDIVTRNGFHEGPERHSSSFRMGRRMMAIIGGHRGQEFKVPVPRCREHVKSGFQIVRRVALCPSVLVEGLDEMMVLCQCLAQTNREDDLAVRQMSENLPDAPFAGCRTVVCLSR